MNPVHAALGFTFITAFIFLTVRRKSLTFGGAVSAAGMGVWVFCFAGGVWLIPLFFFFITGTILGKINPGPVKVTDKKHGKGRDVWQVACNGLPYVFIATFFEKAPEEVLTLMSVSIAIATSDTWSSEIGMYFRGRTFDILYLKKRQPGVSGGISLEGTGAGLLGAVLIAAICIFLMIQVGVSPEFKTSTFAFITLGGFAGMLIDSLLGSAFQIKFKNPRTGMLSDSVSAANTIPVGLAWMTNDAVNFLSNAIGTALFGILLQI